MSADTLAALRRQRAVLATVADVIVAAARGKSLRVAVHGDHRYDDDFADRLTQALLARGRDCRCAPTAYGVAATTDRPAAPGPAASGPAASGPAGPGGETVIISGSAGPGNADVCRVDIQVNTVAGSAGPRGAEGGLDADAGDTGESGDREHHIVVDYLDPDGPTIRHLASWLAPQAWR